MKIKSGTGDASTEFIADDGKLIIKNTQDVDAVLAHAAAMRQVYRPEKNMRYAATLPALIVHKLKEEGIWQDKKRLYAWLNDPDNKQFRIWGGTL